MNAVPRPLLLVLGVIFALLLWRRWAPVSYWYVIVFPRKAVCCAGPGGTWPPAAG